MEPTEIDPSYTLSGGDSAAGIGPGTSAGFGRRSTANSSQTTMPSNPSPADSHGATRYNMGPEKITKGKNAPKTVKTVSKKKPKIRQRAETRPAPKKK